MCGLVGIWRHDGRPADRSAILLMLPQTAHRGPDGTGTWQEGRVAFGHQRLSILDLTEASHEPMLTADGNGVLVYNGEVYNYNEIRRELESEGIRFRSSGDVEVVLHALHHWGPERALSRFDGMFAFAYFDRRDDALWLARDRVGIKPLLVASRHPELIFASEVKALLAHPRVETRIDRHAMTKWLLLRGRGSQKVLFSGVEALQPGSYWKISDNGIDKRQYFHALEAVDIDRLVGSSTESPTRFVERFCGHLKRSVRLHLASDVPLAAMCSGGVDSSLIAAYAKEQSPDIKAYVADVLWPGGEGVQAERVGQHLGIPIHRVTVDQKRFLELWPYTVWHSDGPPTHPSDPALLAVTQTCHADGIKVLLTGEGSDELFGGYPWLQSTYDEWSGKRHSKGVLTRAPFTRMIARTDPRLRQRLTIALDGDEELLPKYLMSLLGPIKSDADRAFLAHCFCSLYDHLSWILHRHDRMGMAASIEMRVPFLENEIFDFAFHLPRRAKLHRGTGKWVVKRAAAKILPRDIVYSRKKGFPVPNKFSRGTQHLLTGGLLAQMMGWSINTTREVTAWLGKDGYLRFHVVGLELWARIFFGGETPQELGEKLIRLAGEAPSRRNSRPSQKQKSEPVEPRPMLHALRNFLMRPRRVL